MYRKIMIITLVYGNYSDLSRFVKSIPFRCEDFKLVIVDSFKDNNTKKVDCKIHYGLPFIPINQSLIF